jgi:hypothetical protein
MVGFVTLLIAYNLQLDGDTLAMLRAVLDTNLWLATHVVAITLGLSGTFLAGILGTIYIVRGALTTSFDEKLSRTLGRMIYGVVCFATLCSLVGTILGGIWADQSWGRFWGWDPKENAALSIVLWNALLLHARWGGYARERLTGDLWEHCGQPLLVWCQHARRRPALLRVYGSGVRRADGVCLQSASPDRPRVGAGPVLAKYPGEKAAREVNP